MIRRSHPKTGSNLDPILVKKAGFFLSIFVKSLFNKKSGFKFILRFGAFFWFRKLETKNIFSRIDEFDGH